MEYEVPWLGLNVPWALDYLFILVGLAAAYRFGWGAYLIVAAQIRSVSLSRFGRGSWAVVTGSSDGIGKAFAEALASQGFNLYLISRNPDKLADVKEALVAKFGVSVHTRAWDFTNCAVKLSDLASIVESDIEGKDVSLLVNNVGVIDVCHFHKQSLDSIKALCTVNCFAISYMARLLVPKLKNRRGTSAIINVSSLVTDLPMPGLAQYSATKRFDSVFSQCLHDELASTGIIVMDLRPGYVITPLTDQLFDKVTKKSPMIIRKFGFGITTAAICAEAALRDLGLDLNMVGHIKHKLQGVLCAVVPEWIIAYVTRVVVLKTFDRLDQ